MIQTIRIIFKYFVSAMLVLAALAVLGFALIIGPHNITVMAIIVPLCTWCIMLVWFLHFRQRVSATVRRWMAVALFIVFPISIYFAWVNVWRLEQYLEHRNWLSYKSDHFIFHYSSNYPRSNELSTFVSTRDKAFEQNCEYLNVSLKDRIDFYIYDTLDEGFAVPDWNVIYADDDQSIGHEMTHIIAYHIAGERQNIKFLDEGIATWLNHSTRVKDHHHVAWELIQKNGLSPLSELGDSRTFRHQRISPYYPAASFLGYLIDNYGVDTFRRLWIANARYPELYSILEDLKLSKYFSFIPGERDHFESTVLNVCGLTLDELDTNWRAWLKGRYGR
ncbi:MAG: hypothetical protein NTX44_06605 [Ignavibacteriales bacterium]|nr:hypothetical protein [Ignavibacteriales bacterium]